MFRRIESKPNLYKQLAVTIICLIPFIIYLALSTHTEKTILILGDSLSSPYGIGPKDSWVYLLQQRLDNEKLSYEVVNSSTPGDTTHEGLERLPQNLKDYHPTLTIIELGANDAINDEPIETIKNNLRELIQLAKKANSKVLLLGMHMPAKSTANYANQFEHVYTELAKQEKVALVEVFLKNVEDHPNLMQDDKLHPIREAQPILLDNVWPDIKRLLKSK